MESDKSIITDDKPPEGDFSKLGLLEPVLKAIREEGYETPTEIQSQAIPVLLSGRDIIGASQTGTGKTAAFTLPLLTLLKEHRGTRCLIVEPTRELAQQVYDAVTTYGRFLNLRYALLFGGVKYGRQKDQLSANPDIVVATPGRLLDHLNQGTLSLKMVHYLVLDEADRMLDMGFMPDIRRIIGRCPNRRQNLLFSATCPPAIENIASWFLKDPERIAIGSGYSAADTVTHVIYPIDDRQKFDLLAELLKKDEFHSVIIFTRTKNDADTIARWLSASGHGNIAVLHSNRSQSERTESLAGFKSGKYDILVATDIASRGIDISSISHVINYNVPENAEDYVHRIGRTGRMRQEGDAVTLYTAVDKDFLRAIERLIGTKIPRAKLEDFDYKWSPVLDEETPVRKRRNKGYGQGPGINTRPPRRRRGFGPVS